MNKEPRWGCNDVITEIVPHSATVRDSCVEVLTKKAKQSSLDKESVEQPSSLDQDDRAVKT
jgi:hypothetical protein